MISSSTGTGDARVKQHDSMDNYTSLMDDTEGLLMVRNPKDFKLIQTQGVN